MTRSLLQRAAPWWLSGAVFLFSGCTSLLPLAPEPSSGRVSQLWQQHVQSVRAQTDWTMSARIAAHSEDDGWNGKLHWQQEKDTWQVSFNAPFGQGGLQLTGEPQHVEMRTSDGQMMVATDVEVLLYQQFGWRLPLNSLRYWVRGVPVPTNGKAPLLAVDEEGRLARLQQFHWQIEYPAYRQVDGLMLPRKVYLENGELGVRLVIDRWESGNSGDGH